MIGPRRDRDWFDQPYFALRYILLPTMFAIACLVLWAVLR
jgi:hypothetical protein